MAYIKNTNVSNIYYYFGPNTTKDNMQFDENYFDSLLNKQEYRNAANYLNNFKFFDVKTDIEHKAYINQLREQADIIESQRAMAPDKKTEWAMDFADKVLTPHGYENRLDKKNEYFESYRNFKDNIQKGSNLINIKFKAENQGFLAQDNSLNIDAFNKQYGYNNDYFNQNGIKVVSDSEGNTSLVIDRTSDKLDELLYNLYDFTLKDKNVSNAGYGVVETLGNLAKGVLAPITGGLSLALLDKNIVSSRYFPEVSGFRYNEETQEYVPTSDSDSMANPNSWANIEQFGKLIDEARNAKNQAIGDDEEILQSSLFTGYITPEYDDIDRALEEGTINSTQANGLRKELSRKYDSIISNFASAISQYDIYTNWENEEDELESVGLTTDPKVKRQIADYLLYMWDKGNVKIGTTLTGTQYAGQLMITPEDATKLPSHLTPPKGSRQITIRCPQLFVKEAQENAYKDTTFRAAAKLNSMETHKYFYTMADGEKIKPVAQRVVGPDGKNHQIVTGWKIGDSDRIYTRQEALLRMSKSMAMDDLATGLVSEHLNNNGEIINVEKLKSDAKKWSIDVANNIHPELGRNQLKLEDVFTEGNPVSEDYFDDEMVYYKKEAYNDAMDVYKYILSQLIGYNIKN